MSHLIWLSLPVSRLHRNGCACAFSFYRPICCVWRNQNLDGFLACGPVLRTGFSGGGDAAEYSGIGPMIHKRQQMCTHSCRDCGKLLCMIGGSVVACSAAKYVFRQSQAVVVIFDPISASLWQAPLIISWRAFSRQICEQVRQTAQGQSFCSAKRHAGLQGSKKSFPFEIVHTHGRASSSLNGNRFIRKLDCFEQPEPGV